MAKVCFSLDKEFMRQRMLAMGLSPAEAAEQMKIDRSILSRILNGKNQTAHWHTASKLKKFFGEGAVHGGGNDGKAGT